MGYKVELNRDKQLLFLNKFRRISRMNDEDALDEVCEFINSILDEYSKDKSNDINMNLVRIEVDTYSANRTLEAVRSEIDGYKYKLQYELYELYHVVNFRNFIFSIDKMYYGKCTTDIKEERAKLKSEALNLANKMETQWYILYFKNESNFIISNITSIPKILKNISEAEEFLSKNGLLTDFHNDQINNARINCAWYRARKKIAEAEIAKGGNNYKKFNKLIGEASITLTQDWNNVFPNVPVPSIDV